MALRPRIFSSRWILLKRHLAGFIRLLILFFAKLELRLVKLLLGGKLRLDQRESRLVVRLKICIDVCAGVDARLFFWCSSKRLRAVHEVVGESRKPV